MRSLIRRLSPFSGELGTTAVTAMTRLNCAFLMACLVMYLIVLSPMIAQSFPHSPLWTPAAILSELATAAWVVRCLVRRDDEALRRAMFLFCIVYAGFEVAWRPFWDGTHYADGEWQWHVAYTGLIPMAVTPYLRARWVWLVLLVSIVVYESTVVGLTEVPLLPRVLNGTVLAGFAVAVDLALMETARVRDREQAAAGIQTAATAAAEAVEIERERVDGLIHDSVMSTLLAASRLGTGPEVAVAAERALSDLNELRTDGAATGELSAEGFAGLLRTSITFVDPTAEIVVDTSDGAVEIPGQASRVLVAAATEAARNAALHAPRAAHRVHVTLRPGRVRIVVADDGPGFDRATVRPGRLGLKVSIIGRMEALAGGRASVDTAPGRGTSVILEWEAS